MKKRLPRSIPNSTNPDQIAVDRSSATCCAGGPQGTPLPENAPPDTSQSGTPRLEPRGPSRTSGVTPMNLPIVCTLTAQQLRERRETVLSSVRQSTIAVEELPNGYAYIFEADSATLQKLTQLTELERQ